MQRALIACIALAAFSTLPSLAQAGETDHEAQPVHKENQASGKHFIGLADYYHHTLYGKKTASGQVLKKHLLTAAHRTLPFGTRVHVTNKRTGRSCVVVINDRGPFTKSKVIDLSHAAAEEIGLLSMGSAQVACKVVTGEED